MKIPHVVALEDKPGQLIYFGTAFSRLTWRNGRWERRWYSTHTAAVNGLLCRGMPREDLIESRGGNGPPVR